MNFFKQKEKPNVINFELGNPFIVYPDSADNAGLREVDIQRFKWSDFLKSRPNIWTEDWLWQSRRVANEPRLLQKKILEIVSSKTKATKKLKVLIRGGVPPELRGSVWWACSGAYEKMKSATEEESYKSLCARIGEVDDPVLTMAVEKDLLRTFPERIQQIDGDMVNMLRRLLLSYALRNPDIGYCQSMNYLAALMLFHLPEEQSFWLFAALIEDIMPPQYYTSSLIDSRVDQQVFQSCMAWKLPKLWKALKRTDTLVEPVICPWFMCLYINVLPIYAVCRIWDCLFLEGSNVLFRVALALMKSKQAQVKQCEDFISVYGVLKAGDARRGYTFKLESKMVEIGNGVSEFSDISDVQFMINSVFGKKWLSSVSKSQIDDLRIKFKKLIEENTQEADNKRLAGDRERKEKAASFTDKLRQSFSSRPDLSPKSSRKESTDIKSGSTMDSSSPHDASVAVKDTVRSPESAATEGSSAPTNTGSGGAEKTVRADAGGAKSRGEARALLSMFSDDHE